jgi:hypothetical protein
LLSCLSIQAFWDNQMGKFMARIINIDTVLERLGEFMGHLYTLLYCKI